MIYGVVPAEQWAVTAKMKTTTTTSLRHSNNNSHLERVSARFSVHKHKFGIGMKSICLNDIFIYQSLSHFKRTAQTLAALIVHTLCILHNSLLICISLAVLVLFCYFSCYGCWHCKCGVKSNDGIIIWQWNRWLINEMSPLLSYLDHVWHGECCAICQHTETMVTTMICTQNSFYFDHIQQSHRLSVSLSTKTILYLLRWWMQCLFDMGLYLQEQFQCWNCFRNVMKPSSWISAVHAQPHT